MTRFAILYAMVLILTSGACGSGTDDKSGCASNTTCANEHRICANEAGAAVCGECLAGFHDDDGSCVADLSCLATTCSGNGSCDDATGVPSCTCEDAYTGDACDECAISYVRFPDDTDPCVDDPCDPEPCGLPNAVVETCIQTAVDAFSCTCDLGYVWNGTGCEPNSGCLDEDDDGYGIGASCSGFDCDDADADRFEGNPEVCDGKDNDCNNAADDGLSDRPCHRSNQWGTCDGTESCQGVSGWVCGAPLPAEEVCDGLDNDCDSETDEDVTEPGTTCENAVAGVGVCVGAWICEGADDWQCYAATPALETCDDTDNDCDGTDDNPWVVGGGAPFDGGPYLADAGKYKNDTCGAGVCAGGTVVCNPAHDGLTCTTLVNATSELCNDIDEDCDGINDNPYLPGGAFYFDGGPYSADAGKGKGESCGSGDCAGGTVRCNSAHDGLECSTWPNAGTETCDGIDNDCNGTSDDPFRDGGSSPYDGGPFSGDAGKFLGSSCGTGACAGGEVVCNSAGDGLTCSTLELATAESCDGTDNDCDGAADELPDAGAGCVPYACDLANQRCFTDCAANGDADCASGRLCVADSCEACGAEPNPSPSGCPGECTGGCVAGVCTIDCNSADGCRAAPIVCPAGFACNVECSGVSGCQEADITCPDSYACNIFCTGPQGCAAATIQCSGNGTCDVNCGSASETCQGLTQTCGANDCRAFCSGASSPSTVCGNACACISC